MKQFEVKIFDINAKVMRCTVKGINKAQIKRKLEKDINRRKPYYKRVLGFIPDVAFCEIREVKEDVKN